MSAFGGVHIWGCPHLGVSAFGGVRIWGCPHLGVSAFGGVHIWGCPHLGVSAFGGVHIWGAHIYEVQKEQTKKFHILIRSSKVASRWLRGLGSKVRIWVFLHL